MTTRQTPCSKAINPSGQDCLVLAAAITAATVAYADPVRYDNDTNYTWLYSVLDLTKSSADQVGGSQDDVTGSSFYLDFARDGYSYFLYELTYTDGRGGQLWSGGRNSRYSVPFNSGDLIGSDNPGDGVWRLRSVLEFSWSYCTEYYCDYGYRGLLPKDGSQTYLGARLSIDNQLHYGWIGVTNNRGVIDVFAWGYESDPEVAIRAGAVPGPGALGVLAIGAAGALSRKRWA